MLSNDFQAEAETIAARRLGPKPSFNAFPTSALCGLATFLILEIFSAVLDVRERAGGVTALFVAAVMTIVFFYQRHREHVWIKTVNEIEAEQREHRS